LKEESGRFFVKKLRKKLLLRFARCSKCPYQKLIKFFCFFLFTKRSSYFFLRGTGVGAGEASKAWMAAFAAMTALGEGGGDWR
jgi:hypothetical protein